MIYLYRSYIRSLLPTSLSLRLLPVLNSLKCLDLTRFFFQAEDGIRDDLVTGVQTCALPIISYAVFCLKKKNELHHEISQRISFLDGVRRQHILHWLPPDVLYGDRCSWRHISEAARHNDDC